MVILKCGCGKVINLTIKKQFLIGMINEKEPIYEIQCPYCEEFMRFKFSTFWEDYENGAGFLECKCRIWSIDNLSLPFERISYDNS